MMNKKAYLTIDDSPSQYFNEKIDFLISHNIPAILFCVGEHLVNYKGDTIEAIKKGFIIGNHSFSHPHFSELSLDACKSEIIETDKIIESLYKESGLQRPAKYFRFPYFDCGGNVADKVREIQMFLKELGYEQPKFRGVSNKVANMNPWLEGCDVRCTFDQMEYYFGSDNAPSGLGQETAILKRIEDDLPEEGKGLNDLSSADIILIHDHDYTNELFYKIVNRYLDKGIQFLGYE